MAARAGRISAGLSTFRRWRRSRPFWAGCFLLAAGIILLIPPYATVRLANLVIAIRTWGGVSALLIGALLLVCGLSLWLRPQFCRAAGVTAVLLALVALVSTNLGGFLVGSLSGLIGGALALSWTDRPKRRGVRAAAVVTGLLAPLPLLTAAEARPPGGPTWSLAAERMVVGGLAYHGVTVTRTGGAPVRTLRFTADVVETADPVLTGDLGAGHTVQVRAASGRFAAARGSGDVELRLLRFAGNLDVLGIGIPVDFTPERPPPLVLPNLAFTHVRVAGAYAAGGVATTSPALLTVR